MLSPTSRADWEDTIVTMTVVNQMIPLMQTMFRRRFAHNRAHRIRRREVANGGGRRASGVRLRKNWNIARRHAFWGLSAGGLWILVVRISCDIAKGRRGRGIC